MRRGTRGTLVTRHLTVAFGCALGLALAACSGGVDGATAPDPAPPVTDPGPTANPRPDPVAGVQGSYTLEQINGSQPGQLVTLTNPDGKVIGLYRFDASSSLDIDGLQGFDLQLRYSDDKAEYGLPDEGDFQQQGPVSQEGALPLTLNSAIYGGWFTGVALGDIVAIKYDFDGDGQLDTSFGFRRTG
jgi:hypothetical protein